MTYLEEIEHLRELLDREREENLLLLRTVAALASADVNRTILEQRKGTDNDRLGTS